jgi:hypothetical protein
MSRRVKSAPGTSAGAKGRKWASCLTKYSMAAANAGDVARRCASSLAKGSMANNFIEMAHMVVI